MNRYHTLNIDKFIRESIGWDEEIREKQEELSYIGELKAIGNSEVHSTEISKVTERDAMRRLKLVQEIERIENYKYIFQKAFDSLDELDQRLIKGFYFPEKMINKFVKEIAAEKHCTERYVYTLKRLAVDNMKCEVIALDV